MKKLCITFPGVGYTNHKPLLHYSGKLALGKGYELVSVEYRELPSKIGKDPEKMKLAFEMALEQTQRQLSDIDWSDYDEILLVGKSIGTVIMSAYIDTVDLMDEAGNAHKGSVKSIYLTPLKETFIYAKPESGIVFHGTGDPWAATDMVTEESDRLGLPLYTYEGANHSLETGDVQKDIENLADVMSRIDDYIS